MRARIESYKSAVINGLLITSLTTLMACGGTVISDPINVETDYQPSQTSAIELKTSIKEFGFLKPSGTLEFSVAGGKAPYELEIVSGGGSLSQRDMVYTAPSSEATVLVRVTDAEGAQDEFSFYVAVKGVPITVPSDNVACLAAGTAQLMYEGRDVEVVADTTNLISNQVIVGLGVRAWDRDIKAVYLRTNAVKESGITADPAYQYTSGNLGLTTQGEIYIQAPAGYYVYGFGAAGDSTGNDMDVIKIYVAKPVQSNELQDFDLMECMVTKDSSSCSDSEEIPSSMQIKYGEYIGHPSEALVGLGLSLSANLVDWERLWAKSVKITVAEDHCSE